MYSHKVSFTFLGGHNRPTVKRNKSHISAIVTVMKAVKDMDESSSFI